MTISPLVMAQFRRPVPPSVPDKMPSRQEVQGLSIAIKPVTDLTPGKIVRPTGKRTVLVVQVDDDPVAGTARRLQSPPALRDDVPGQVVDDDLGALRAAVDADQVRAPLLATAPVPGASGRDSRRPRRGCAR